MARFDLETLIKKAVDEAMASYELIMGITIKEAVEKQIPKAPIDKEDSFSDKWLTCPTCGNPVTNVWSKAEYKPNYCHYCGQKFDWEEKGNEE